MAAKSLSVCGSKLDRAAQLFALKAAFSLHYLTFFNMGRGRQYYSLLFLKGVAVFCI